MLRPQGLTDDQWELLLEWEAIRKDRCNRITSYFPDSGPLRRELYQRHLEFFSHGKDQRERLFMAANRVGKTESAGGYETALHLTGAYPDWWPGRRFDKPVKAWAAGDTSQTVRDILQFKLLGPVGEFGTGLIPGDTIVETKRRAGNVPDLVETVRVKHVSGGVSTLGFKSYDQGREAFQGTEQDVCLAAGELVQMWDGTLRRIEDVRPGDEVVSLNGNGGVVKRKVTAVASRGEKDCIQLRPKRGTFVSLTPDHKVYEGYRLISKAEAKDATAIAQMMPGSFWPDVTVDRQDAWYVWAALYVAEGCYNSRKITCGDIESLEAAIGMLPEGARVRRKDFRNEHVPDWFLYWDAFWAEVEPGQAEDKAIPDWVFTSSKDKVCMFLRWLFSGDGWANYKTIGYATTSQVIAAQIVVLLNRLGIRASMYIKKFPSENWKDQYWVQVTKSNEVLKFVDLIGIEGKGASVESVRAEAARRVESKASSSKHLIKNGTYGEGHRLYAKLQRAKNKNSKIRCRPDIGRRAVYDISVEGEHRFFAGVNLVSNCWLDEEPPSSVYGECLMRTMTTGGLVMLTFTPLLGLSEVVLSFLPDGRHPEGKCVVMATWDDVPHLSEADKADMLKAMPPHMRDARSKGIPALGAGAIYPVAESDVVVADFEIPDHWPRVYGLDVGWNNTATIWAAWDRDNDCVYLYSEYKRGQSEPATHAAAIRLRGDWLAGVIDPAAAGAGQRDGVRLLDVYKGLGLDLRQADNQVEAGILEIYRRLSEGRLKVFRSCQKWLGEYRVYRRDDKGRIVKSNDHLMDATRYLIMSGLPYARVRAINTNKVRHIHGPAETAWMGA